MASECSGVANQMNNKHVVSLQWTSTEGPGLSPSTIQLLAKEATPLLQMNDMLASEKVHSPNTKL